MLKYLSTGEVAATLGIKIHQIMYAHANGYLSEPDLRVAGKRVYGPEDIRRLAEYFNVTLPSENTEEEQQ